jgi:hypothetical protein
VLLDLRATYSESPLKLPLSLGLETGVSLSLELLEGALRNIGVQLVESVFINIYLLGTLKFLLLLLH